MMKKSKSLGRWELLGWLNEILQVDYAKVGLPDGWPCTLGTLKQ